MPEKDPYEPVRVKDRDTGYHLTIQRQQLPHGNYQELKQDAIDPNTGAFLPPDYAPAESATEKKDA